MNKKYKLVTYYRRSHEIHAATLEEAQAILRLRALRSRSPHYTELWEMTDEENGEQIGFYENSNVELVQKD